MSKDLASEHNLPGALGITRDQVKAFVELDIPTRAERIDKMLVPAVEVLCLGFVKRLSMQAAAHNSAFTASVGEDYIATWVSRHDLDHFLVALSALLEGAKVEVVPSRRVRRPALDSPK
ncbi:hypothetical protein [Kutzneria chonburiensis]|uniref:Uncharacterized protein n=1 Tax=Kutzneria chonburiensis TaxID=1483604 RepID=A0ABV6MKI6_9PSEU|nr:hypothetical protein [Kutzneria chonburiensis]